VVVDRTPPYRIHVFGTVHERSFYGPKLELRTEVSTVPGSDEFRIDDTVINHGATLRNSSSSIHQLRAPLLEKGATVLAPSIASPHERPCRTVDRAVRHL